MTCTREELFLPTAGPVGRMTESQTFYLDKAFFCGQKIGRIFNHIISIKPQQIKKYRILRTIMFCLSIINAYFTFIKTNRLGL